MIESEQLSQRSKAILERLAQIRAQDAPTHGGRVFSYVYDSGLMELDTLAADAARIMQSVNGLDPTTFPSVAQLEKEVISFAKTILNAPKDTADISEKVYGSVTSGGTASCLLAVKTARDIWVREGGIGTATIVAPSTVHAAFHKAAEYFGLRLIQVPVDADTRRVDAESVLEACDAQTALIVLSAPNYPYGLIDPIAELGPLAKQRGIPLHVDACFGGFVLPWWEGEAQPWDFRVPGVTSISADLHKYGYAPKGVSTLLQRGHERHRSQYFAMKSWPGYPVVNATLVGSRPAGPIAASWAILQYLGDEGFQKLTRQIQVATAQLAKFFRDDIVGVRLAAESQGPVVVIETDDDCAPEDQIDPHMLSDQLRIQFGWISQAQPGFVQNDGSYLPPTTHFTMTPVSLQVLEELQGNLRLVAEHVRGQRRVSVEELLASVPAEQAELLMSEKRLDASEIASLFRLLGLNKNLEITGDAGRGSSAVMPVLPQDQTLLMTLIERLPDTVVKQLLVEVLARQVESED